ncbi:DUF4861 family protein [Olivibacter sp. SDN3]|uniref:DUF4861 family protein n=1 Tax=Olivibacter sp. SDN3 TaxID=2764720 RepID=UPI00165123E3|nr:DUF4861 family protein [Olivibacter sp. SDN3]QNL50680.1 DUF4861 family protein [Olivibacter sp. SDN3]
MKKKNIQEQGLWGVFLLIGIAIIVSCKSSVNHAGIVVNNPSSFDRKELVEIPYKTFSQVYTAEAPFRIIDENSEELTYQLVRNGEEKIDHVLIWVDIPANDDIKLFVEAGEPTPVEARTYARYVPERFDDFAWENDKVAFRMYGKALEGRADDAHGTDIWAKRTDRPVIDEWYKTDDYHKDHGEGLDYYAVGMTLGAGDIAPFVDDKISYSKHYREHELLENGPLRSTFKLTYEPWEVGDRTVSVTKNITLEAGSQLNKVEVTYSFEGEDPLPVVAGIVLREEDGGKIIQRKDNGIAAYWEPGHGDDGTLGVAVVTPEEIVKIFEGEGQLLTQFEASSGKPMVYYNGGAWDKAGEITSAEAWEHYLTQYQEKIKNPLTITIQ